MEVSEVPQRLMSDASQPLQDPLNPRMKAIIVGASRGFGAALAEVLAREGYDLALLSRDKDALDDLAGRLRGDGEHLVNTYRHDVREHDKVPRLFETATRELGGLDLLVYNSGIMDAHDPQAFSPERDLEMLRVNLLGGVPWLILAGQRFLQAGSGHLVGVGSIAGERGRRAVPGYSASKAGLHTYLEALRNRLDRHGVIVTTLKPGQMETRMLEGAAAIRGPIKPERAAELAWRAIRRKRRVAFIPSRWSLIALVIRNIPGFLFRRLDL